jgi:hypothetical protein
LDIWAGELLLCPAGGVLAKGTYCSFKQEKADSSLRYASFGMTIPFVFVPE